MTGLGQVAVIEQDIVIFGRLSWMEAWIVIRDSWFVGGAAALRPYGYQDTIHEPQTTIHAQYGAICVDRAKQRFQGVLQEFNE